MYVYQEEDIRHADETAVKQGVSMTELMDRAGKGIFNQLQHYLNKTDHILILAGPGNNGGDGIVLAHYLAQAGFSVELTFPLGDVKSSTANQHLEHYQRGQYTVTTFSNTNDYKETVIVDALLGIGTSLPLRQNVKEIIQWCNKSQALKIAIDLPTGLVANHGEMDEEVFKADYTFALHGVKPSAFLMPSSIYYGEVKTVDIGLPQTSSMQTISHQTVQNGFVKRSFDAHKGSFGTGLLIAGTDEMPGSVTLSSIGAIRTGIGKLLVGTTKHASSIVANFVPEATFSFQIKEMIAHQRIPDTVQTIAIGPGLDDEEEVKQMVDTLWETDKTLILDAGALLPRDNWHRKAPTILTPHPGEFSRLTGVDTKTIQANRIELAKAFSTKHHLILILKGTFTTIAFPNGDVFINLTGNDALAKGGSGDVLTGMLIGMIHNTRSLEDAVRNAVYIHGLCADEWKKDAATHSMVASDFQFLLPKVMRTFD